MSESSRTKKSIVNVSVVLVIQVVNTIIGIINRTIFIQLLGNDYLSVNGLFSNILTLLSFAELGIGNAIIFSLYRPISEKNNKKICEILNLYRRAYWVIFVVVFAIGVAIIPFLDAIISDVPDIQESIVLIYVLFIVNAACSYLFSYKSSLLIADQKNYIVSTVHQTTKIAFIVLQTIYLYFTRDYIGYLVLTIIATVFGNVVCTFYANKHYPFVKNVSDSTLPKEERSTIFSNIKSLFIYKIGAALLNGSDNIIISSIIQTAYVGICSNYTLVINTINTILMQMCNSIVAGIGNHNVESAPFARENKFKQIDSLNSFIFSFSAVCLVILLNPLIMVWLGNDYVLDIPVVVSLSLSFYVTGSNQIASLYRTTLGLFEKAKMVPFTAAIINIVLSIVLGKYIGLLGVFIATSISKLLTFNLFDPILIYKYGFNKKPMKYFVIKIGRFVLNVVTIILVTMLISLVPVNGLKGLLLKTLVCGTATFLLLLVFYIFDVSFRSACVQIFKNFTRKRIKNGESN